MAFRSHIVYRRKSSRDYSEDDSNLSFTINLSDFGPKMVYDCYRLVSGWKCRMQLETLDENHQSKLEVAVQNANLPMVLVLLENGCTHMKNVSFNVLEHAQPIYFWNAVSQKSDVHEWTPLTVAVNDARLSTVSRLEIVKFLLRFDQDLDVRDEHWLTAAHWAIIRGFPEILHALLEKGADVQAVDDQPASLMDYAINQWRNTPAISIDLVNVLLEEAFDVDTRNAHQNTPLHLAVLASSTEIVLILLRYNANKRLRNIDGHTPIDIARTMGASVRLCWLLDKPAPSRMRGGGNYKWLPT
jgi:ankyrin repeat protein